ncbi:sigma 54-interacting transcriptional regulator [Herbaspirillum sp. RTI4]|uniref:sigma-54 interaction domain-containing protein n=1 Tax=Herbaspirillum sp. RTI4 TaxID=3048640 RepID=UPI002AB50CCB|nr:sigma 54-interacting transcriptional regulator [Herbaspirillum sp. RTI4]MDY7579121.1 sigma 54-interacting transcriptional regulator [Herbaspirillum sp. RTI4]MEA9981300.1 sigma 54-interacting transcriptional regulator [Herbaspirillum sp. RTI4]
MKRDTMGILVIDDNNTVMVNSGLAHSILVSQPLAAKWTKRISMPIPRLFMLEGAARALTCFYADTPGVGCFLIFDNEPDTALLEFFGSVDFATDIMRHLITNPFEAMTVVDSKGLVRYLSPVHEKFFNIKHLEAIGKHVTEVIENTHLHEVAISGKPEIGQLQEMHGTSRVVRRTPIFDRQARRVGAIGQVMFKGPDAIHEMSDEIGRLRKQVSFYERELSGIRNRSYGLDQIIGSSAAVKKLKADIVKVAPLDVPVLLVGESGTGKELVAHAIHLLSPRSGNPLVLVNAAAMPANLVESELFGYEAGAFTGADRKGRQGKFEAADRGTLFLDEIGDMPPDIQVKLLRVLQDGSFERVGGDRAKRSDFRLISASNRDFKSMIANGSFRLDVFYRISTITLRLPPLRDRLEDIPELAEVFLAHFAQRHGSKPKVLDPEAVLLLQSRPWPGNVRQLQHAVERAAVFCETDVIGPRDLESIQDEAAGMSGYALLVEPGEKAPQASSMQHAKDKVEAEIIQTAMQTFNGNKKKVAESLHISRSYLYKKLAQMNPAATDD